jgi:Cyclophilin type peptidyl-prolyl cis-trans isomerase/CLD
MYFLNPMGLSFAMLFGGTAYAFYRMTDGERHGPSKPPTQHQVPAAAVAKPANNVISRDVEQYPCYMDVSVDGKQLGRVVFELFWAEAPKTAENFRALCVGDVDPKLSFKGSRFHRIIPRFMVQGGDITRGDGMGKMECRVTVLLPFACWFLMVPPAGGMSIYGAKFADEPFVHKVCGFLGWWRMARSWCELVAA